MKILFLTLLDFDDIYQSGIYTDLIRKFSNEGHSVTVIYPSERRKKRKTTLKVVDGIKLVSVWTFNIQKTSLIEKGVSTLLIEYQYLNAIKSHLFDKSFDLVMYSTPPISFTRIVSFFKKKYHSKSYLLLKDIFPQNAVDLGVLNKSGLLYKYFRNREKKLYKISDTIGCMSEANVAYVKKHNSFISSDKIEVNPNSIEIRDKKSTDFIKNEIRYRYNVPQDAIVLIYGGNLGKPQGIKFLLNVIESNRDRNEIYFLIVGNGTEYKRIHEWFEINAPVNAQLLKSLPKDEFNQLVCSSDVGLLFLDPRFTIPNFPSRLLSYLENKIPVLAGVDESTDIGNKLEDNDMGYSCINGDISEFNANLNNLISDRTRMVKMGRNGYNYLCENYSVEVSYRKIIARV